jgi:hypothetical protein
MEVSVVLVVMRMTQKGGGEESYNIVVETIYRHDCIVVGMCVVVVVVVVSCMRRMYEAGMLCGLRDNPATSHSQQRQECETVSLQVCEQEVKWKGPRSYLRSAFRQDYSCAQAAFSHEKKSRNIHDTYLPRRRLAERLEA